MRLATEARFSKLMSARRHAATALQFFRAMSSFLRYTTTVQLSALVFLALMSGLSCDGSKDSTDNDGSAGAPGEGDDSRPACDFGPDESKCEGRADITCTPFVELGDDQCERDAQCGSDELCLVDQDTGHAACSKIVGECSPQCGGDFDCPRGEHCHPKDGTCQKKPPTGERYGQPCDPVDSHCQGTCVEFDNDTAECEEHCRVGAPSGFGMEELEGSGVACAYFAYDLSALDVEQGAGDTGICARLCDCDDDCPGDQICLDFSIDGKSGICTGGLESSDGIACSP
jgi:hypothetical protein